MSKVRKTIREEITDPETRWCPMATAHPARTEQVILLYAPGVLDDPVQVRFGDLWWTEAGDTDSHASVRTGSE